MYKQKFKLLQNKSYNPLNFKFLWNVYPKVFQTYIPINRLVFLILNSV